MIDGWTTMSGFSVYEGLLEDSYYNTDGAAIIALPGDIFIASNFMYGVTDVVQLPDVKLINRIFLGANVMSVRDGYLYLFETTRICYRIPLDQLIKGDSY